MDFRKLLILAKSGSHSAINKLIQMYQSVLVKESIVNGILRTAATSSFPALSLIIHQSRLLLLW